MSDVYKVIRKTGGQVHRISKEAGTASINVLNGKTHHTFNPYENADDDYAVLEWMRKHTNLDADYQVGDYTRLLMEEDKIVYPPEKKNLESEWHDSHIGKSNGKTKR